MKFRAHRLAILFFTAFAIGAAQAQSLVPRTLSYQGTLSTSAAVPVNGAQTIVFSLYNAASGGTALWTETQTVNVANGLFNVTLGSSTPINLPFNVPYFLGVTVGADAEMAPRSPLASSAYAMRAKFLDAAGPGSRNTFAGVEAGGTATNIGQQNTAFGRSALRSVGDLASYNTAVGDAALASNASGRNNTAIGQIALGNQVDASDNTAVGSSSLASNVSGNRNTAVGFFTLGNQSVGNDNTAIGNSAMLFLGTASATGEQNTAIGSTAAQNLTTGNLNLALGFAAGSAWTTGDNNIAIGNAGVAGESNIIRLGTPGTHTQTFLSGTVNATKVVSTDLDVSNDLLATKLTASTIVAPKIGANVVSTAIDRPVTIKADTTAGGSEWISLKNSTGATKWHVNNLSGGVNFAETGLSDARLFLAAGGNVGVGTSTPTKATLEVNGSVSTILPPNWGLFSSGLSQAGGSGNFGGVSIYASHLVAAGALIAFSDQRMKRITGRSNAARDLATLSAIEITDYTHIDTANRGDKPHKKVIAQQVEKIYPQAVNQIVDVVPDIYRPAPVKDGWIMLATNLKKGDRVRLIGKAGKGEHEVLEVADGRFRTAFKAGKADGDTVFVYGREVKDFRTVDYEAISMLNVSATQELHRRAETQAAEIAALRQELQEIRALLGASKTAAPKKP